MTLGDAILACLTERPMTGYEHAKTFDVSIGFLLERPGVDQGRSADAAYALDGIDIEPLREACPRA